MSNLGNQDVYALVQLVEDHPKTAIFGRFKQGELFSRRRFLQLQGPFHRRLDLCPVVRL